MDPRRLIFVGGLHRSGTTPLAKILGSHPEISGISGTDVPENEGIHLQDVYPKIREHGGMGSFAHHPEAHLTENSVLATEESARRLIASWEPYWDLGKPLLLEKTPSNLVMGRFLQKLFPGSALIVIIRHPVVVALANAKWDPLIINRHGRRHVGLYGQVAHWVRAHEILRDDLAALERTHVVHYEELMRQPQQELASIQRLLGLSAPISHDSLVVGRSATYAEQWAALGTANILRRRPRQRIERDLTDRIRALGYDVNDVDKVVQPWNVGDPSH